MCCKGFFKRVIPFFLTFSIGLLVASFFVTVAAPNFQFNRGWSKHRKYHQRLEFENQRLREENTRLKRQLENKVGYEQNLGLDVPPPPPIKPTVPYRAR